MQAEAVPQPVYGSKGPILDVYDDDHCIGGKFGLQIFLIFGTKCMDRLIFWHKFK